MYTLYAVCIFIHDTHYPITAICFVEALTAELKFKCDLITRDSAARSSVCYMGIHVYMNICMYVLTYLYPELVELMHGKHVASLTF